MDRFHLLSRKSSGDWFQRCVLAGGLMLSNSAFAIVATSVHPYDQADSLHTVTDPAYIGINPGLVPLTNSEGFSHTISVEVDSSTGTIRGYSGYNMDAAGMITRTDNLISTIAGSTQEALVANVTGSIIYDAEVVGPSVSGPINYDISGSTASIFLDVEGSFNYLSGSPSMGLVGLVSVTVMPAGNPLGGMSYVYGGRIANVDDTNWIPDAANVFHDANLQVFDAFGNAVLNPVVPGVAQSIDNLSLDPGALTMRVMLTVPINNGDRLVLGGSAAGATSHAFLEDFRAVGVGQMGNVAAAEGYVDFLNTATMGIALPEGFSLVGDNAPPAGIVITSPVPWPSAAWMFLSGMLTVLGASRLQARSGNKSV